MVRVIWVIFSCNFLPEHHRYIEKCGAQNGKKNIYLVDSKGLITSTRGDKLADYKVPFARSDDVPNMKDLLEIVAYLKPHALFGLTGGGPAFSKEVVEVRHRNVF